MAYRLPELELVRPVQVAMHRNRGTSVTQELLNRKAIQDRIDELGMTYAEVAEKAKLARSSVRDYATGAYRTAMSQTVDKLAKALQCDAYDLVLHVGEENPLPPMKPYHNPLMDDARKIPKPVFVIGERYAISSKMREYKQLDGIFRFMGEAPGNDRIHYMFEATHGKYLVSYTDIDINTGNIKIEPVGKKREAA